MMVYVWNVQNIEQDVDCELVSELVFKIMEGVIGLVLCQVGIVKSEGQRSSTIVKSHL